MKNESVSVLKRRNSKLSVIGLGKLGLCTAACFAEAGYSVVGVDNNPDVIQQIQRGKAPYKETGLQELLIKVSTDMEVKQSDYQYCIEKTDTTFLIVPTPSTSKGNFSNQYLIDSLTPLAKFLSKNPKPYHLFVVISTVTPGSLMEELIPLVEFHSNRQFNKGFGMCYNPEFIALGSVIQDFFSPDMVLIGEGKRTDGNFLEEIYRSTCKNQPYFARMSIPSAEITKISLNAFVTMKISFVNTLTELCDGIPEADIDSITSALGADKRIGKNFLQGGAPFGGPCFPRDNLAFSVFAQNNGSRALLAEATDQINQSHSKFIIRRLEMLVKNTPSTVGIIGCAYKPFTSVIEESFSIQLIRELQHKNYSITIFDPAAVSNVRQIFKDSLEYADSLEQCVNNCAVIVITLPDKNYSVIGKYLKKTSGKIIFDLWRVLKDQDLSGHQYLGLGRRND
ncbi:MAG: nucleotide sugar dehydrogenase [Fidelibacterota bacterium]